MKILPTIVVVFKSGSDGYKPTRINESDYNKKIHQHYAEFLAEQAKIETKVEKAAAKSLATPKGK